MACTDVANVKAKATVINLIIFSSNVNFQTFVLKSRLSPQRQYNLIAHHPSGPDDAAAFGIRCLENTDAAAPITKGARPKPRPF
jgi:hypothetical protein